MSSLDAIVAAARDTGAALTDTKPPRVWCYGDLRGEHRALAEGPGVVDRRDRAMIEITGRDRTTWLHNLTTNEIKKLAPGEGNYAYVLNVQGRIQFDVHVLVRPESILLDLDRRWLSRARAHFEKFTITEDVAVNDLSDGRARLALTGMNRGALLDELGAGHARNLPACSTTTVVWRDVELLMFRHDGFGVPATEIELPDEHAGTFWRWLCEPGRTFPAAPIGVQALQIRRMEAGIPWPMTELHDGVLPAETGQLPRAVSFQKGCYLGQEVVERMRSRGIVARRLVGLLFDADDPPQPGTKLLDGAGNEAGSVTSACRSIQLDRSVALGYVKAALAIAGTTLLAVGNGTAPATVADLPMVGRQTH